MSTCLAACVVRSSARHDGTRPFCKPPTHRHYSPSTEMAKELARGCVGQTSVTNEKQKSLDL